MRRRLLPVSGEI